MKTMLIPFTDLVADDVCIRDFKDTVIKKYAKDLYENGLMQHITVRELDNGYGIVNGYLRYFALKYLYLNGKLNEVKGIVNGCVPCINLGKIPKHEAIRMAIRINEWHEETDPITLGFAMLKYIKSYILDKYDILIPESRILAYVYVNILRKENSKQDDEQYDTIDNQLMDDDDAFQQFPNDNMNEQGELTKMLSLTNKNKGNSLCIFPFILYKGELNRLPDKRLFNQCLYEDSIVTFDDYELMSFTESEILYSLFNGGRGKKGIYTILSEIFNKSKSWISQTFRILVLPRYVLNMIKDGILSWRHGIVLSNINDNKVFKAFFSWLTLNGKIKSASNLKRNYINYINKNYNLLDKYLFDILYRENLIDLSVFDEEDEEESESKPKLGVKKEKWTIDCKVCGYRVLDKGIKFCPECGTALSNKLPKLLIDIIGQERYDELISLGKTPEEIQTEALLLWRKKNLPTEEDMFEEYKEFMEAFKEEKKKWDSLEQYYNKEFENIKTQLDMLHNKIDSLTSSDKFGVTLPKPAIDIRTIYERIDRMLEALGISKEEFKRRLMRLHEDMHN